MSTPAKRQRVETPTEYPEEEVPFEVPWAGTENFSTWGIYPELIKGKMPFDWHFRPRFAMALAMHARQMNGYDWQNSPFWHSKEIGWTAFQGQVLGLEKDWTDPPSRTETLCAWLIWYTIRQQTIHGATPEQAMTVYSLRGAINGTEDRWIEGEEGFTAKPFNRTTLAIAALALTTPAIRHRYNLRVVGTGEVQHLKDGITPWSEIA